MWQCTQCEYFNEDLDDMCARCEAERVTTISQVPAGPDLDDGPTEPPGTDTADDRSSQLSRPLAFVVIVVCILALAAVGYVAWQRGLITLLNKPEPAADGTASGESADIWAAAPPCPASFARKSAPARKVIDAILAAAETTAPVADSGGELAPETISALGELAELGSDLAWEYGRFEQAVVKANDPRLGEYVQFVRDRFELAMLESIDRAGSAYVLDQSPDHPAYLLSDIYVQAADEYHLLDSADIRQVWAAAVHLRLQRELDQQYTEHYRQLSARVETLKAIHSEFNAQLSALPPYQIRSGRLGRGARDLLELLATLVVKIEELVVEYEDYTASLAALEQSDRMVEYFDQFESLAMIDHLYAFEEIYKIYEQDRELTHPGYLLLSGSYSFALVHWPESALNYEEIYEYSERKWELNWAQD